VPGMEDMRRIVLVFVDGLGIGRDDPAVNPLLTYGGGLLRPPFGDAAWCPLDATSGLPGLPQSATGQTALLTGIDAASVVGGHRTGFPGPELREILREHSLLRRLHGAGRRVTFLNAYRPLFWKLSEQQRWRLSATTVATLAAGLPFWSLDDLRAERCVYQEVTNRELISRGFDVPVWTPQQAGRVLARNLVRFDFTLFEYFQTDRAGHAGDRDRGERILRELDGFLGAVLEELRSTGALEETLVLLTSDHGNIEDATDTTHTRNPVPLAAWGAGAEVFVAGKHRLVDVPRGILELLGIPGTSVGP